MYVFPGRGICRDFFRWTGGISLKGPSPVCNDRQKFAPCLCLPGGAAGVLPESVLATADTCPSSACHCEPRSCNREHLPVLCMSLRPCPAHTCQVSACPRAKRPCNRAHASSFSMSLRTSAHTGAAIRVPAEKLCKLAILRANLWRFSDSPKVLLFVLLYCEENGLSRRFAPRNDMQKTEALLRVQGRGRNDMQKAGALLRGGKRHQAQQSGAASF